MSNNNYTNTSNGVENLNVYKVFDGLQFLTKRMQKWKLKE